MQRFSLFKYLKYLGYKALHAALVGKARVPAQTLPVPVPSETPGDPPRAPRR
jgi:hypothetical protein